MNNIFNEQELLRYRQQAALNFGQYNFLKQELATRLLERLDHARGNFPLALDLNSHLGEAALLLQKSPKVQDVIASDYSSNMLKYSRANRKVLASPLDLPFAANSFNVVVSAWGLHSFNNLPQILSNIFRILKKDGLLLIATPCYGNLSNLSGALYRAESQLYPQEVINRVHPFMDVKTLGNLVKTAGFTSVIADKEKLIIMYQNLTKLFKDLRGMGEHNVLASKRSKLLPFSFYPLLLKEMEFIKDKENNHYPINVEFCNIMAWKP